MGLFVIIWDCFFLVIGFMWELGGLISVWFMILGMFFFLSVEISVLFIFSWVIILVVLNLGLGWNVLVVVLIVFWFCGVNVCNVCWIWLFNCFKIFLGILRGFCVIKYILIFFEWMSCIICVILFLRVFGVFLNKRWVLLKKKMSFGFFGLLIFGSFLNNLDKSYKRKVV